MAQHKDEKDEKPAYRTDAPEPTLQEPEVTPQFATPVESAVALRENMSRAQIRLSKGSKSDIDKIVPLLGFFIAWIDIILANGVDPPPESDPLSGL